MLDGDTLYIDRYGDGDLTAPDNRLRASSDNKLEDGPITEIRAFADVDPKADKKDRGNVPLLRGTRKYTHFYLEQLIPREDYLPKTPEQEDEERRHKSPFPIQVFENNGRRANRPASAASLGDPSQSSSTDA